MEKQEEQLKEQLRELKNTLEELGQEIKRENPDYKLVEILGKDIMRKMFHYGLV